MTVALLAATVSNAAWSSDVYIVSGTDISINREQIKQIFLGQRQFVGDIRVLPVDNSALRDEFLKKEFGIDVLRYATLWANVNYRDGLKLPALQSSDEGVLRAIKTTPGAVGYVTKPTGDVKVLDKL